MLAIIGVIYGALVAMVQPDVKKLVAYSSVSHLGLVVLGIFAFNHVRDRRAPRTRCSITGSRPAALFLPGRHDLRPPAHACQIADFGGLAHVMPVYSAFFMVMLLSSIGLPGLNGFVGEFLILQGTFLEQYRVRGLCSAHDDSVGRLHALDVPERVFMGR